LFLTLCVQFGSVYCYIVFTFAFLFRIKLSVSVKHRTKQWWRWWWCWWWMNYKRPNNYHGEFLEEMYTVQYVILWQLQVLVLDYCCYALSEWICSVYYNARSQVHKAAIRLRVYRTITLCYRNFAIMMCSSLHCSLHYLLFVLFLSLSLPYVVYRPIVGLFNVKFYNY